jgi:2-polyprenyl-3-methyl-5-hydroxy-6-metoxy-1,4-benzoquinol methylase
MMFTEGFSSLFCQAQSVDARLSDVERRLSSFYTENSEYYEEASGKKDPIYHPLLSVLARKRGSVNRPLKVIELGAGRTSFPAFVRESKVFTEADIDFLAHDINGTNSDFYEEHDIKYIIGDWEKVSQHAPFDVLFCTYVYEHLVSPHLFLENATRSLSDNGSLVIVCPKYVVPGYVPPAIRWLPSWQQHALTCRLSLSNLGAMFLKRPKFWICTDAAFSHRPFRRDYDAVHMVSSGDLRAYLEPRFSVRSFPLLRGTWKERLLDKAMLMSVIIERNVPFV